MAPLALVLVAALALSAMVTAPAGDAWRPSSVPPGSSAPPGGQPAVPTIWRPAVGTTWQWQLTGRVDTSVAAAVFDIDGQLTPRSTIRALRSKGRRLICYVDAGAWESYRPDAAAFPRALLGRPVDGWPDERWLDVRKRSQLLPLIDARVRQCRRKGFHAVEFDMVDGYANRTGFPITAAQQVAYNQALAHLAHRRGMSAGLKNAPELVTRLVGDFDFAIVEECVRFGECRAFVPFIRAGKAVLHVEYTGSPQRVCAAARRYGFSSMRKRLDLGAYREPCPTG